MSSLGTIGEICHQHGQLHVEWKMKDVFSLSKTVNSFYSSPTFNLLDHSFYLKLYSNGESKLNSEGWIGLYLMAGKSFPPIKVQYTVGFKTAKEIEHKSTHNGTFSAKDAGFGNTKALRRTELRRLDLTPSDVLTISATLKIVPNSIKGLKEQVIGRIRQGKSTSCCIELFWEIDNALHLIDDAKSFLFRSPPFSFKSEEGELLWDVKCFSDQHYDQHLLLYAKMDYPIRFDFEDVNWCMGILYARETEGNTRNCQMKQSKCPESILCWLGPSLSELLEEKEDLCPNGVLTFFVRINLGGTTDVSVQTDIEDAKSNIENEGCQDTERTGGKKVLEDIGKLWRSGENSDVVMQVEDVEFKAHRTILAARTPVLAAMFQHDTTETATGVVTISDCEPAVFEEFLHYVYTGVPRELTTKKAPALYEVANKYLVEELKAQCLCYIRDNLCVDSFCDTALLALNYGEAELLEFAVEFASKNIRKIIKSVEWQRFNSEHSTAANEILIKALGPE